MARYIFKRKLFGVWNSFGNTWLGRNIVGTFKGISGKNYQTMYKDASKLAEEGWTNQVRQRGQAFYTGENATKEATAHITGVRDSAVTNVRGTDEYKALGDTFKDESALKAAQKKMEDEAANKAADNEYLNWGQNNISEAERKKFLSTERDKYVNDEGFRDKYKDLNGGWSRLGEGLKFVPKLGVAGVGVGAAGLGAAQMIGGVPVTGAINDMRNATKEDF